MNSALEVLRDLRSHPLRSVLSALSVFMTVASIITIIAASGIARDVFVSQEEQLDGRAVTVSAALAGGVVLPGNYTRLYDNLRTRVTDHGGAFTLQVPLTAALTSPDPAVPTTSTTANVVAVSGALLKVKRLPVISGRWLRPDDQSYPLELVTNQAAATTDALGRLVGVRLETGQPAITARTVGVIADGVDAPQYYLSLGSALTADPALLDHAGGVNVLVHRQDTDQTTLQAMTQRALTDTGIDLTDISVTRADHVAELAGRLNQLQRGFLLAAAVSTIVALLGLLNIGLASVRERSRELVVRRAIGATRLRLFALVSATALIVALSACAVAFLAAALAIYAVLPHYLPSNSVVLPPGFPWTGAAIGLAAAIGVAALSAAYPATVAARIDVATALRD